KKEEKKKEEKKVETKELRDAVTAVAFSPDGTQVLSVGFDKELRFWSVADGKEVKALGPMPDDLLGLAVSRDGKRVATAGYGGSLRVFEYPGGKEVFKDQLPKGDVSFCVAFAPDGKALVVGRE